QFHGLHVYSPGKLSFDNTLVDQTHGVEVRSREIAGLWLEGGARASRGLSERPVVSAGSIFAGLVEKVAGGFTNIDGLVTDGSSGVYFVDQAKSQIFHWSAKAGLTLTTDAIPQPVALALDRTGNLVVVSRHGNIYAFKPGADE